MSTQTRAFIKEKIKYIARNEKLKKLHGFSYSKNMANFEAFHYVISSSINLLFLKSLRCILWKSLTNFVSLEIIIQFIQRVSSKLIVKLKTLKNSKFLKIFPFKPAHFEPNSNQCTIRETLLEHTYRALGVKVRNMKMDFNIYGSWRQVGQ